MKDDLLHELRDVDITNIKYHVNTCYANYRKKKERLELKKNNDTSSSTLFFANTESPNLPSVLQKELRHLAIKSYMWKTSLFVIKRNAEEIIKNYVSVRQDEQSSSSLQSSLIKTSLLQDSFCVRLLMTCLLLR